VDVAVFVFIASCSNAFLALDLLVCSPLSLV